MKVYGELSETNLQSITALNAVSYFSGLTSSKFTYVDEFDDSNYIVMVLDGIDTKEGLSQQLANFPNVMTKFKLSNDIEKLASVPGFNGCYAILEDVSDDNRFSGAFIAIDGGHDEWEINNCLKTVIPFTFGVPLNTQSQPDPAKMAQGEAYNIDPISVFGVAPLLSSFGLCRVYEQDESFTCADKFLSVNAEVANALAGKKAYEATMDVNN